MFACVPGHGHLHPMVPLAQALQDAGHGVAFATEERYCRRVEKAGFTAFATGIGPGKVFERTMALPEVASISPDDVGRFGAYMFAAVAAPEKVPPLVAAMGRWPTDVVVHDCTDFAGPVAAAHLGLPYAAHSLGPLLPLELYRLGGELAGPLWHRWGAEPGPLGGMFRHLYLDICPPSLQSPELQEIDGIEDVTRLLRPVPFDHIPGEELPPWVDELSPAPIVYVTLGTLDNHAPGVIETVVEALRGEDINLAVTVGPDRDPSELGPQPPNVHVERYIPQSLLLPRCDVVVTHGGSGTTLAALSSGLPLLLLPQGANQFQNADRCLAVGVGARLLPGELEPAAVRHHVRALLQDGSYRRSAQRMAAEIAAMPGPESAVPELERLVGNQTR